MPHDSRLSWFSLLPWLFFLSLGWTVHAAEVDARLNQDESLQLEQYTDGPTITLKEAIDDKNALKHKTPALDLNFRNIIKQYDHPEDANLLETNLDEVDPTLQLTLADLRVKALQNNLNIKVAKVDPNISR